MKLYADDQPEHSTLCTDDVCAPWYPLTVTADGDHDCSDRCPDPCPLDDSDPRAYEG